MSDNWTESDNNCFEDLVADIKMMKRIKPYQILLMMRSLIYGANQLDDETRGLFVSLRVYYYDKKREREKDKIIKMCKETKPPEKAAKPTFNVNKEPMITSIDFKENSKSGRKGEIKIQTDSLDRFKLTNEVKEVESEDKEERNKVVNSGKSVRPKNGADKKGKENGKTKPDQSPVEKKRNIHFSLKVNKDSPDIEPEDLIFEHNQQRQQLIQAQELLIVNNKIDEAIIDVLGSVVEKLGTSEIKEAMISILNLLRGRRSMTKNDLNKIKMNLSENLGKIIENTKLYCEKTFVYSNKIELTSIESKLKTS